MVRKYRPHNHGMALMSTVSQKECQENMHIYGFTKISPRTDALGQKPHQPHGNVHSTTNLAVATD